MIISWCALAYKHCTVIGWLSMTSQQTLHSGHVFIVEYGVYRVLPGQ